MKEYYAELIEKRSIAPAVKNYPAPVDNYQHYGNKQCEPYNGCLLEITDKSLEERGEHTAVLSSYYLHRNVVFSRISSSDGNDRKAADNKKQMKYDEIGYRT